LVRILIDLGRCQEQSSLKTIHLTVLMLNELNTFLLLSAFTILLGRLLSGIVVIFEKLQEIVFVDSHKANGFIARCINQALGW
jgi:hypothetical protein